VPYTLNEKAGAGENNLVNANEVISWNGKKTLIGKVMIGKAKGKMKMRKMKTETKTETSTLLTLISTLMLMIITKNTAKNTENNLMKISPTFCIYRPPFAVFFYFINNEWIIPSISVPPPTANTFTVCYNKTSRG
jgi:hypothetical protein